MLGNNLKGFQHIGLPVTDIEQSAAFYQQFGFKEVMHAEVPAGDEVINVKMLELGGMLLELYQPVGDELADISTRNHGHVDHFALDVENIDEVFATVKAAGFQPLQDAPITLSTFWNNRGASYFFIEGPDGERVEFCERLK